jgi:transposase InsO family protein
MDGGASSGAKSFDGKQRQAEGRERYLSKLRGQGRKPGPAKGTGGRPPKSAFVNARFGWAPHHWAISRRGESSPWHRLGVRPRLHRRHLARRLRSSQGQPAQRECFAFLEAAVAYFAKLGIRVERVMTDNGSCYRSKTFRAACKRLGLRQIFTRPYTPKTNGKAERFIQTALREWA